MNIKFYSPDHIDGNDSYQDHVQHIESCTNGEPCICIPLCHDGKKLTYDHYFANLYCHGFRITDDNILEFKNSILKEIGPVTLHVNVCDIIDGKYVPDTTTYHIFVNNKNRDNLFWIKKEFLFHS